ncbi:phenylalanine--tRNA ligase subunit beta [bacterium]|nr:phenylalanine--tRNA ligase subunit beta [bacterium]
MKLSLRWIFDHLNASWTDYKVEDIVARFNMTTAEIEHIQEVTIDVDQFALAKVTEVHEDTVQIECSEWHLEYSMPLRTDAAVQKVYVIKKNNNNYAWATLADWHSSTREGLIPAVCIKDAALLNGGWKKTFEVKDYSIEVDNKSITNRPDLWGHRGIAREIAAIYNLTLKSEKDFLASVPVLHKTTDFSATKTDLTKTSVNLATKNCSRVTIATLDNVDNQDSSLWMLARLARIDARPINFLVDATNYVMFDCGHPMHAFDAAYFMNNLLEVRMAKTGEKLVSLDGVDLELTDHDIIITDGKVPVSLAGIKGGISSGVSNATKSLIIEAACFDSGVIRLSAAHHKLRTEASTRFEKTLDPEQTVNALLRYINLLHKEGIVFTGAHEIVSVGAQVKPVIIELPHAFIESRLGVTLPQDSVVKLLKSIECQVSIQEGQANTHAQDALVYSVAVPSFRSSKDIKIPEDLVEEIGRLYGYNNLIALLPAMTLYPSVQKEQDRIDLIKNYLSSDAARMQETQSYALFDNDFMQKIKWPVVNGLALRNPLTVQSDTMVTSLVPNLLKNVEENVANSNELRFFELAKIFNKYDQKVVEHNKLAGIFFKKHEEINFYQCKEYLQGLFKIVALPVVWKKSDKNLVWASKYQSADLYVGSTYIGSAGRASLRLMTALTHGSAFIFELDADFILSHKEVEPTFKQLPSYQATHLDISFMSPLSTTVADIEQIIAASDTRIFEVAFIDQFQKPEWENQKSLTFRFGLRDSSKSLSKDDIDAGFAAVVNALKVLNIQVRS